MPFPGLSRPAIGFDNLQVPERIFAMTADQPGEIPLDAASPRQLQQLKRGCTVAAALPFKQSIVCRLPLPKLPTAKLTRIVPSLLDERLPFPVEDACIAWDLEKAQDGAETTALCTAAPESTIKTCLTDVQEQGVDPELLLAPGPVLWQFVIDHTNLRSGPLAILHRVGDSAILILGDNGSLLAAHPCRPTEAAVLRRTIDSVLPDVALVRWVATGEPGETASLSEALGDPDCERRIKISPDIAESALSRGLAMAAREGSRLNLRTKAYTHEAALKRAATPARVGSIAMLTMAALLCGASLWALMKQNSSFTAAHAQAVAAAETVAGYRVPIRGDSAEQVILREWDARAEPALRAFASPSPLKIISLLIETTRGTGITIHRFRATSTGLTVSASSDDRSRLEEYADELNRQGFAIMRGSPVKREGIITLNLTGELK